MKGSPQQIALVLRRKAQAMERAMRQAEAASAAEALHIARELSSGTRAAAQLRAAGHPYRVGGSGPPLPINRQSGRFYAAWRIVGPRATRAGLKTSIVNADRKARWLMRGTRRMMARPVLAALRAKIAAARAKRHRQALKAIHGG